VSLNPDNSTNSLASPISAGNFTWQIDIANLANLIGRIGAEGLKKLQLSGLDLHTVGCLLALGEVAPASHTFRSALQKARTEQRSQKWWFYNAVEFGSGSNFAVDTLLKTRAGENVLALLSSVVSVTEDDATEVLSLLFEKLNTPPSSTPSVGQLENLRSVCLPLARRLDFKDRLVETHQRLLRDFNVTTPRYFRAEQALPDSNTMAELIKILRDVVMQRDNQQLKLFFYGTEGAAWLALYSWKVLDLTVCFVHKDGKLDQTHGSYSLAHVVIFPEVDRPSEIFQLVERPSDVMVLASKDKNISATWLASCGDGGVDIFGLYCGWDVRDRQEVGNLIYSIACEYVTRRIREGLPIDACQTLLERNLGGQLHTLRRILLLLGLPQQLNSNPNWRRDHYQAVVRAAKKNIDIRLNCFSAMLAHVDEGTYEHCSHPKIQPQEMSSLPTFCVRCALHHAVQYTAYVASCLSFTDWAEGFKKISIQSLPIGIDWLSQLAFSHFNVVHGKEDRESATEGYHAPSLDRGDLAKDICQICCGSRYGLGMIDSNPEFLGINLDGVLLIDYRALDQSLQPGPIFILREGEFCLGEERRSLIFTAPYGSSGALMTSDDNMRLNSLKPWNYFENSSLTVAASLLKTGIQLRYTFLCESDPLDLEIDVPVANILPMIRFLYVASTCSHPFNEPLPVQKSMIGSTAYWLTGSCDVWKIDNLLSQAESETKDQPSHLSLCPALKNPLAQWASLASWRDGNGIVVLQQQACLKCVGNQAIGFRSQLEASGINQCPIHILSSGPF
jgi:hypothetical protein